MQSGETETLAAVCLCLVLSTSAGASYYIRHAGGIVSRHVCLFVGWFFRSLPFVGAEYLENSWRQRLGSNGPPIRNGPWANRMVTRLKFKMATGASLRSLRAFFLVLRMSWWPR